MQDYGFRLYNPGLGRFLSVDPLAPSYPWYTPYQFAGNKPINSIDLDGLEDVNIHEAIIAKKYWNSALDMDMRLVTQTSVKSLNGNKVATTTYTKIGNAPRNYIAYWNHQLKINPEMFSAANLAKIRNGAAPTVDLTWVKYNPSHSKFMDDVLIHHHKYQGNFATAVPIKVHNAYSKYYHPFNNGSKYRLGLLTRHGKRIALVGGVMSLSLFASGQISPVDLIDPIGATMVVDAFMEDVDQHLLEVSFSQGYEAFSRYIQNCQSCGDVITYYATTEEAIQFVEGEFKPPLISKKSQSHFYPNAQQASNVVGEDVQHGIMYYDTGNENYVPIGVLELPQEE